GQADALEAAGAALDGGVDADDLALQVDQRAAGVAGVDGRVGLDEVLVHVHVQATALGADDAVGHGAGPAERGADGQDAVADLHGPAVAQFEGGQVALGVDADDGQVGLGVDLDLLGREPAAVGQHDLDLVGAVDDVVVGQDDALGVDDEAGA